jgi:hypothetical protein
MKANEQNMSHRPLMREFPFFSSDRYMQNISTQTAHSLGRLKLSPKKIPDMVGTIMEDVVIKRVMCIGPEDRESIL